MGPIDFLVRWLKEEQYNDHELLSTAIRHFVSLNSWYIEDHQIFGVNMTFISSNEVKKGIFHEWQFHI